MIGPEIARQMAEHAKKSEEIAREAAEAELCAKAQSLADRWILWAIRSIRRAAASGQFSTELDCSSAFRSREVCEATAYELSRMLREKGFKAHTNGSHLVLVRWDGGDPC